MDFHVLDELTEVPGLGALLFTEELAPDALAPGARIRDARGREHAVLRVERQEGLTVLTLDIADAEYLGRLLRDVRVDGARFTPC